MATLKPRITITLSDEQHQVLHALAELQKVSMSSIVVDLLETAMPSLERLSTLLEIAEQAPKNVMDGLRTSLQNVELELMQMDLLAEVPGRAHGGARPGTSAASKKARPPSTNRGVRIPPLNSSKAKPGAGSKPVGKGAKK